MYQDKGQLCQYILRVHKGPILHLDKEKLCQYYISGRHKGPILEYNTKGNILETHKGPNLIHFTSRQREALSKLCQYISGSHKGPILECFCIQTKDIFVNTFWKYTKGLFQNLDKEKLCQYILGGHKGKLLHPCVQTN